MPAGRPTKYQSWMADKVIEMAEYGASKHEMALELGIVPSTFEVWQKENPEFSGAVKEAERISQGWWEKQGRIATFGGVQGFNPTSYIFNMKNRFKQDWRDKHDHEMTGADGGPIKTEDVTQRVLAALPIEALEAALAGPENNGG